MGAEGVALAPLRPSGPARFGTRRIDVLTGGAFIEAGGRVRVTAVHGSRVVVEPLGPLPPREGAAP